MRRSSPITASRHGRLRTAALLGLILLACAGVDARLGDVGLDRIVKDFNTRFGLVAARDATQQFLVLASTPQAAQVLAARAAELKRDYDRQLRGGRVWDRPALVVVYPDEAAYREDFVELPGTDGGSVLTRWRSQPLRMIGTFPQPRMVEEILPHEMVHLLVKDLAWSGIQTHGRRVPLWIDEGLAVTLSSGLERRVRDDAYVALALRAGAAFPVAELVHLDKYPAGERVRLFYAQCHSIAAFLLAQPGGIERARTLIQFTNGSQTDPLQAAELAFRGQFGGYREFVAAWMAYLDEQYQIQSYPGRVLAPPEGPASGPRLEAVIGRRWAGMRQADRAIPLLERALAGLEEERLDLIATDMGVAVADLLFQSAGGQLAAEARSRIDRLADAVRDAPAFVARLDERLILLARAGRRPEACMLAAQAANALPEALRSRWADGLRRRAASGMLADPRQANVLLAAAGCLSGPGAPPLTAAGPADAAGARAGRGVLAEGEP